MRFLISALFLFISCLLSAQAQFSFTRNSSIEVFDTSGQKFEHAWVGGLNNPQFSSADLNNDGEDDLIIFNRTNSVNNDLLLTFLYENGDYVYAPEFEKNFPTAEIDSPKVEFWMLIQDYNCDGIPDLFSTIPGSIQYYKGKYNANNELVFEHQSFLQFNSFTGPLNIFISSIDIPAIVDVNFDGDLDVLTFNIFGFIIEYYENQSMELTGTCGDSMIYNLVDDCWGGIFETGITKAVEFRDTCSTLVGKTGPRHSGSTILGTDVDDDGDIDLMLGDISFPNINLVINGGDVNIPNAVFQDTTFPTYNVPVNIPIFPAAFKLDVDHDGRNDLVIAPNSPRVSENFTCAWYYKNISPTGPDSFQLITKGFIVEDMIDLGEGANPVFIDVNQDGLLDLIIGNFGYFFNGVTYISGLAYFENIGTANTPKFQLKNRDWMGLSSLQLSGLTPSFADLDNDGDLDMILGEETGQLFYFTNTSGPGNPIALTLTTPFYFGIDIGQFSDPTFYDVNQDGLLDLVVGERSGNLNYFENKGTASAAVFDRTPTNSFFGKVDVRYPGLITGFSSPKFASLDSTGKIYLLVGSESKGIMVYDIIEDSIGVGGFPIMFENFSGIKVGEKTTFAIGKLNDSKQLSLVAGNYRGGLTLYSQTDTLENPVGVAEQTVINAIQIFPNPVHQTLTIKIANEAQRAYQIQVRLLTVLGEVVYSSNFYTSSTQGLEVFTHGLSNGMYILELTHSSLSRREKVLVHH